MDVTREMAEALDDMRRNMQFYMDSLDAIAKLKKHKYDALVREGFQSGEALELCKGGVME